MKNTPASILWIGATLWTAWLSGASAAEPTAAGLPASAAEAKQQDRHVIVVSLDGIPAKMWQDEALPAPTLRRLAREGASAQAMTVSNPSITWICHTTMSTGVTPRRHGVIFNGLLTRQGDQPPKIEPWVDKAKLVFAPTIYDLAYQAGLTTAEVDWVAITRPGTIHWSFPELPSPDGKVEQEMIAAGLFRPEQCEWFRGPKWKNMAWHDEMWTKAACFLFKKHHPNLLLFHHLNSDAVNHQNGPSTNASYTTVAYADRLVGDLLQTIEETGLRSRTTVVVVSDHGHKTVSKVIYPNVAFRKAGYLKAAGAKVTQCDAAAVAQGGLAMVYITDPAKKAELLPKLKQLLAATEGIAHVHEGSEGPAFGMPLPEENQGMADLFAFAKNGYAFKNEAAGDDLVGPSHGYLGTHGYPATDADMDAIFLAWGAGIKPQPPLARISNLDVAPTVARLLGLEIPKAEGRVLTEILDTKPATKP